MTHDHMPTMYLTIPVWDNDDNENCYDKFTASTNNSSTHAKNGNHKTKKIKIIQINKGSADLENRIDLLMTNIREQSVDIAIIS